MSMSESKYIINSSNASPRHAKKISNLSAIQSFQDVIKSRVTDDLKDNSHAMPIFSRLNRSNFHNGFGTTGIISGLSRVYSSKKLIHKNYNHVDRSSGKIILIN
jgi:hypothetical protein